MVQRATTPDPLDRADGRWECAEPTCGLNFATEQGARTHWSRSHKVVTDNPGELFDRTRAALEALFPEGPSWDRMVEYADMQKQMLKWISR